LNDRKKKAADEKRAREEEYEESKEQMEVRKLFSLVKQDKHFFI
jgi:hypothetical protein